ncbi:RteC domain-containing protein [Lutibacter citreus]|uniref:RteC domain-containing protein n=1 Tax=Lutibacter citreus TaxID=2138210 RepID=UPI000DBEA666|nr:RteC domain-containing protein [Lutibacter citreus]
MKSITLTFNKYKKAIAEIEKSDLQNIKNLDEGIKISRTCLNEFSILVRSNKFSSKGNEITFFKYQKPFIEGRLLYFKSLRNYWLERPVLGVSKQRKFIVNELKKIDTRKCKQLEFVKYYRLKKRKLDHIYFLRSSDQLELFVDTSHHFKDPEFTTSHDYLVSKIVAQDLLITFFSNELEALKKKKSNVIDENIKPIIFEDLQWTGTKTELLELIFALHSSDCLRNGNSDLKRTVELAEKLFNVELGNINKTLEQIKSRKKDLTKFLNKLTISLSKELTFEV